MRLRKRGANFVDGDELAARDGAHHGIDFARGEEGEEVDTVGGLVVNHLGRVPVPREERLMARMGLDQDQRAVFGELMAEHLVPGLADA